jgi:hypothetical protein
MKKMLFVLTLLMLVTFVSETMAIQKPASEPVQEAPTSSIPGRPVIEKMEKFLGTIEKVDDKGKIIVVKGKMMNQEKTLTFVVDDQTKMTKGKAAIRLGDLKKEMQVSIEYKKLIDQMIAVVIEVSIPKKAP